MSRGVNMHPQTRAMIGNYTYLISVSRTAKQREHYLQSGGLFDGIAERFWTQFAGYIDINVKKITLKYA